MSRGATVLAGVIASACASGISVRSVLSWPFMMAVMTGLKSEEMERTVRVISLKECEASNDAGCLSTTCILRALYTK